LSQQSPLEQYREYITSLDERGESNRSIAAEVSELAGYPVSHQAIGRALARWEKEASDEHQVKIEGDDAEVTTKPVANEKPQIGDPEDFMRAHGIDPDEWEITSQKLNWWDSPTGDTLYQQTVHLKRKQSELLIVAARSDGWTPPAHEGFTRTRSEVDYDGKLVVFVGDQQAPFHDKNLHRLFCDWLEDNEPDEGVLIGDTVDFPDISRHRLNPENTATVNECIQSGYDLLRGYVEASQHTFWRKLAGNHDERLRNTLLDRAAALYGVARAGEKESVLSVSHLLRLDELGIEYIDPQGGYSNGQVRVSDHLAARHGWLTAKGSGASALKTLEHLGYSVVIGHTHRQSLVYKTTHDIDGQTTTLAAAETGCMCRADGLGYAVTPDWQQGWATATIYADGKFRLDHATYVNGTLMWRDQRYE
jgi:hypothetical protein